MKILFLAMAVFGAAALSPLLGEESDKGIASPGTCPFSGKRRSRRFIRKSPHEEANGEVALHVVEGVCGNDEALLERCVKRPTERLEVGRLEMLQL